MGRQKSSPKKRNVETDYAYLDYIPVKKRFKRKVPSNNSEKFYKISLPADGSRKFYLGQLLLGSTSNLFPEDYTEVKISFKFPEDFEAEESTDEDIHWHIILIECDKVLIVIKSHIDMEFIKDIVCQKVFVFDFIQKDESVFLKIYLGKLPLPRFNKKLGSTNQTLFSLLFNISTSESNNADSYKKNQGSEITKLYEKLTEMRKHLDINQENVQHNCLIPKLRLYQEKSVQWMLHREKIDEYSPDRLHPFYTTVKLETGCEIYFDKYSGFITSEKPLIPPSSKGGILADEMGLGKTVEVLACILLHPKEQELEESDEEIIKRKKKQVIEDSDLDDDKLEEPRESFARRKKKHVIEDSDDDSDTNNKNQKGRYILDSEIVPVIKKHRKKRERHVETTAQSIAIVQLPISPNWVKQSRIKSTNRLALEMWYDDILSDMSPLKSASNDQNRIIIQCICGSTSKKDKIKCIKCSKYQHKECFGYRKSLGKYICPECWKEEPLLESKATLIVTPMALKTQWLKEICRHLRGNFQVLQYERSNYNLVYPTELKDYDIVLTTYSVLQNELRLTERTQGRNLRNERRYSSPGSPLTRLKWWRLCLDEAQTVEVSSRMVSEMAGKIDAVYRWAVTGTPISKSVSDIHGLIDYLQITPYDDVTTWKKILYEPYMNGDEGPLLDFLSNILWRTAKKDVTDQINIPKQTYLEHKLEFSAVEKFFYKREHELICHDFLSKISKYNLSISLENLDKSTLKQLISPLLTLRHACTHPNTVRGRYLATKKKVKSMKELLNALILKNTNVSEDCLRIIISSLNGMAGIHLLLQQPQEAISNYRDVLQLEARFSGERAETKLTIDKPQVIHAMYNLAEVFDFHPPDHPTLRDDNLRKNCQELEKKYMEKFITESTSAFQSFSVIMSIVEKMHGQFILKDGQWYSDGLNWLFITDHFADLQNKIRISCENASIENNKVFNERTMLQFIYKWDSGLWDLRAQLFEAIEMLYDCHSEDEVKIIVKESLVPKAMNCHLRPQKKGKQAGKCPVCIANDYLKKYEVHLFDMKERGQTLEELSLKGSWKLTLQEAVLKSILSVLKAKNSNKNFIKDGELYISIIEQFKKEFKEIRRLWTFLFKQINAKDELDICKVRLQLKTEEDTQTINKVLKNLSYQPENKTETIHLLSVHELDYQMSLLQNEFKQNSTQLEKLLGTQSYLETLMKQQYEGQSPDPCPICKNTLEQHWSILSCGHSYCLECIQVLLEQTAGDHIHCSICRNKQKYQDISYIKAGNTINDDDTKNIQGNYSTKIEAVIKLLLDLKNKDSAVKVLLFSSWITVLKCLKEALDKNSISCELAQSVNLVNKITSFKDPSKNITVILLPINLGSKGLNLIEATHVILVEPVLNPADELQAIGRVNRIGQTKETFIHKFFISNTIEENIQHATTSNAANWEKSRVTLRHLADLFGKSSEIMETPDLDVIEDENLVQVAGNSGSETSAANLFNRTSEIMETRDLDVVEDGNLVQVEDDCVFST